MSTLKDRMAELRREKPGVKNADLAREAGVKSPSVTGWFKGGSKSLQWESVDAIARLYGVCPRWVARGEGPKYPASPWPFSYELHTVVSELDPDDLHFAENALRSHLRLDTLPHSLGGVGKNGTEHR